MDYKGAGFEITGTYLKCTILISLTRIFSFERIRYSND
jgi:hypothetical protein